MINSARAHITVLLTDDSRAAVFCNLTWKLSCSWTKMATDGLVNKAVNNRAVSKKGLLILSETVTFSVNS